LYQVEIVPVTNIEQATVGVVKSNVGEMVTGGADTDIVERGQRGIWRQPLLPQKYYLHTKAYEVTVVSTEAQVIRYTKAALAGEENEITVRSSDGFTFPVDVRVEYEIKPADASLVVARFRGDVERLRNRLNSAVRAIFRNNAETLKALDYVQQRSLQESQSLAMLADEMIKVGLTITAVRIGDVGDEESLGTLLKTQTDREIALQEQMTFQEQQRAAEQKKALTRTEQEAEEERRLATAKYEVQIAEQARERRIIEAGAEAEAIRIQAEAQAEAYRVVAQQIGPGNAALVELLKIVGERGINITPRVMVVGGANGAGQGAEAAETTALIGTMLDTMVSREPLAEAAP
ncbi:MAG: SPFH domain-containing protein, partial [Planctomycetota bacterium]